MLEQRHAPSLSELDSSSSLSSLDETEDSPERPSLVRGTSNPVMPPPRKSMSALRKMSAAFISFFCPREASGADGGGPVSRPSHGVWCSGSGLPEAAERGAEAPLLDLCCTAAAGFASLHQSGQSFPSGMWRAGTSNRNSFD